MHHIRHKLLILSLCSLPSGAVLALDDLDVTIRVIDRQEARLENFTNRIELPRDLAPRANPSHPSQESPTQGRTGQEQSRERNPSSNSPPSMRPGDGRPQPWDRSRTGHQQTNDMRDNVRQLRDDGKRDRYPDASGGGSYEPHEAEYPRPLRRP